MILVVALIIVGVLGLYMLYRSKYNSTIPTTDFHPMYGHLHTVSMDDNSFLAFGLKQMQKFGHIYNFWMGPFNPMPYVCSADGIKTVLQNSDEKGDDYKTLVPWFGKNSIIISSGEYWKNKRMKYTDMFRAEVLKQYIEVYANYAEILLNKWNQNAQNNEPVDMLSDIKKLTLCVGNECIFDNKLVMFSKETEDYHHKMEKMAKLIYARNTNPFLAIDLIYRFSSNRKETNEILDHINNMARKLLTDKKKNYDPNKKFQSIVDLLLDLQTELNMSDNDVIGEIDAMLFASHDTSSHAIMWTIYALSKHPEIEKAVIKEANEILGDRDRIEADDLPKLKYLKKVVNESLRMYPPASILSRKLKNDVEINGHKLKKGQDVVMFIYLVHHNPLHWKDPSTFNPDRFDTQYEQYSFIPFSTGSRNCLGRIFALNEILTVLAMFYKKMVMKIDKEYLPRPVMILKPHETMVGRVQMQHPTPLIILEEGEIYHGTLKLQ